MASSCGMRGLHWILEKLPRRKDSQALEQATQENGGVTIPGSVKKLCGWGHGLGMNVVVVLGALECRGFSNLNDSVFSGQWCLGSSRMGVTQSH